MDLEITPYEGIGPIRLGMSREEVRKAVGGKFEEVRSFDKKAFDGHRTGLAREIFPAEGILVDYKVPGICVAVEVIRPSNPIFQGLELLATPFGQLSQWFQQRDKNVTLDLDGLRSRKYGICLWAPDLDAKPGDPPETVFVFEERHYEKYDEGYYEQTHA